MEDNKYWLAIGATILVMALLFYKDKKEKTPVLKKSTDEVVVENIRAKNSSQSSSGPETLSSEVTSTPNTEKANDGSVEQQTDDVAFAQFSQHLKSLSKCFSITPLQALNDKIEPSAESLMNHLRTSLGDPVVQMDDWSQTEIDDQGVKKTIRVDYDYPDGAVAERRLSMFKVNSFGATEIINLTPDQTNNPNEAYIDSLIEGQKILNQEKEIRAYYSDGEELIFTTKNGRVKNLTLSKSDRTFSCIDLTETSSNCICQ